MSTAVFSNVQEVDVDAEILNAANLPVAVENVIWESADESIVQVIQNPTAPLSAILRSTGLVGSTQVFVMADADLSEGELPVLGVLDVEITESGEFRVEFTLGDPRRREE